MAAVDTNGVNGETHLNFQSRGGKAIPSRPSPKRLTSYAAKFKISDHFIGGNRLEVAQPGAVTDFVEVNDGHTVITNVSNIDWN